MAHESSTIQIGWQTIYNEAVKLSSYEGRSAVTPSGESDYQNVRITDQDKDLIITYITQAIAVTEEALSSLLYSLTDTSGTPLLNSTTTFVFVFDGARVSMGMLTKMIVEAIASHVMMLWLSERKSSRVDFYNSLFDQMITSIKARLTRKIKPSLDITY